MDSVQFVKEIMDHYKLKYSIENISTNKDDIYTHKLIAIKDRYTLTMSFNNSDPHISCIFNIFKDGERDLSNFGKMDQILENFIKNF